MEPFTASGLFNLPNSPARAVRGDFTFDGESSIVELHDALVEFTTPHGQVLRYGGEESAEHAVIHGRLDNGDLITMLGAHGSSRSTPFGRFESWRCNVALLGAHAPADSFDRIAIQFDCLRGWAEPPPIVERSQNETATLDLSNQVLGQAKVEESVVSLIAAWKGEYGGNSARVQRTCSLTISCPPTPFAALAADWVRSLHELMILLVGAPVRLTSLRVHPEGWAYSQSVTALYMPVQKAQASDPTRESLISYGRPTAYVRGELPISFEQLVKRWVQLRAELPEAVTLLCGPFLAPFMYLEHRFSAVFQSAEMIAKGFGGRELEPAQHKVRVQGILDAAVAHGVLASDIEWAKRRLESGNARTLTAMIALVVESVGPVGEEVLAQAPDFARTVASARSDVAHPSTNTASTHTFYWYGEVLTWVVRAYLLKRLGIAMEHLHEQIRRRGHFTQSIAGLTT